MRIVINGVGIAGPTLAYWLRKYGHEVLLVEQAPRPEPAVTSSTSGGSATTLPKRWACSRIRELGYLVREVLFVDRQGRQRGGFSVTRSAA